MLRQALLSLVFSASAASADVTVDHRCDLNGYGYDNECVACVSAISQLTARDTRYGLNISFSAPQLLDLNGTNFGPITANQIRMVFGEAVFTTEIGYHHMHAECVVRSGDDQVRNPRVWFRSSDETGRPPLAAQQTKFCNLGDENCERLQPTYVSSLFGEDSELE